MPREECIYTRRKAREEEFPVISSRGESAAPLERPVAREPSVIRTYGIFIKIRSIILRIQVEEGMIKHLNMDQG